MKSIWAFPARSRPRRSSSRARAAARDLAAVRSPSGSPTAATSSSSRGRCRRRSPTGSRALGIKGVHDQNEYRRFYPAGETLATSLGFTGDRDVGQEGIELAQQEWLGGKPGSRRVIINRRGDAVEDVEAIRAPQAGRDLALAIDTRLQYLAFRELKAAVEANKAKAGGLVILDAETGEILALANWPTYNPNARNKVARERMRNRALTDVFEPGSTMKPFTIAAALDVGKLRPSTR